MFDSICLYATTIFKGNYYAIHLRTIHHFRTIVKSPKKWDSRLDKAIKYDQVRKNLAENFSHVPGIEDVDSEYYEDDVYVAGSLTQIISLYEKHGQAFAKYVKDFGPSY